MPRNVVLSKPPDGQVVKTPDFHSGNTGSTPVRVTKCILLKGGIECLLQMHTR